MGKLADTYKHKGLRLKLVETVRSKGIHNEDILDALNSIPRHYFLDSSFLEFAYQDKPFPIGAGQTISQPYTVAFQTQLLEIRKGDKVLEIGTGSGYQACVLLELGAKVFTIERQRSLFLKTKKFLPTLGYHPRFFYGDGYKGLPAFAPYDKMIVTAAAPSLPDQLLKQLKIGGKLVIPLGSSDVQTMKCITRVNEKDFEEEEHGYFRFVPLLSDLAED